MICALNISESDTYSIEYLYMQICNQLSIKNEDIMIYSFDRINMIYKI